MGGAPISLRPQRPPRASRFDEKPTIAELEKGQPIVSLKPPPWGKSINVNYINDLLINLS